MDMIMDYRIHMREASSVIPVRNHPSKEQEDSTAAIVKAGNPDSEISMISRPPMLLGALLQLERTLTSCGVSDTERHSAASILIWSFHRPHRLLAGKVLAGIHGLDLEDNTK